MIGGAGLMIFGWFVSPWALQAMNTPADILPHSITYIRIYFLGIVANFIYNMGSGILRAVGDSQWPLFFLVVCCLLNIILDVHLVIVIPLGVLGVAIGTIFSQLISAVLVLLSLTHTTQIYHLDLKKIVIDPLVFRRIVVIGIPAGLQSVMYSVANITIQSSINTFGTDASAAWTAYTKIDGFFWMTISAFGIAITTFSGQNFGAAQYDRIRKGVRTCIGMTIGVVALMSIFFCQNAEVILHFFTDDASIIQIGMEILYLLAPLYATYAVIENITEVMRGVGNSVLPMIITCLGICVLRIAWVVLIVPRWHTIRCVCISYPITWIITCTCFVIYYLHGNWMQKRIILMENTKTSASDL